MKLGTAFPIAVAAFLLAAAIAPRSIAGIAETGPRVIQTVAGMPPVVDPNNLYSETPPEKLSQTVTKHLSRVYVPNRKSNDVAVNDPATFKVIDRYPVGRNPQHVVLSWDLKTLWLPGRFDNVDTATGKIKSIPVKTEPHGQTRGTFHYARGAEP